MIHSLKKLHNAADKTKFSKYQTPSEVEVKPVGIFINSNLIRINRIANALPDTKLFDVFLNQIKKFFRHLRTT
jgi:siroheme synthase (precorrin-2 oxidase/ferrochelatase)